MVVKRSWWWWWNDCGASQWRIVQNMSKILKWKVIKLILALNYSWDKRLSIVYHISTMNNILFSFYWTDFVVLTKWEWYEIQCLAVSCWSALSDTRRNIDLLKDIFTIKDAKRHISIDIQTQSFESDNCHTECLGCIDLEVV